MEEPVDVTDPGKLPPATYSPPMSRHKDKGQLRPPEGSHISHTPPKLLQREKIRT